MTKRRIRLGDDEYIKNLRVREVPVRHAVNGALRDVLNPICVRFATDALTVVQGRTVLEDFEMIPRVRDPAGRGTDMRWRPALGYVGHGAHPAALAPVTDLSMPIGAYGPGFTAAIWFATYQLVHDWRRFVEQHKDLPIAAYGGREHQALVAGTFQKLPKEIICEGIQSIGQALAQLCAHEAIGYRRHPDVLLQAIARAELVGDFTALLTFNGLATASREGQRCAVRPLITLPKGIVRISEGLRRRFSPARQQEVVYWGEQLAEPSSRKVRVTSSKVQQGAGCPGNRAAIAMFTPLIVEQTLRIMHRQAALSDATMERINTWQPLSKPLFAGPPCSRVAPGPIPASAAVAGLGR
jgi:hypothetical protein